MFSPLPKRDAYRSARFYRASLPNALRTVPVTTVPLLQKAGVLPKRFIQPQNKKYRRAVAEQSPAFNFVPVAQFGDEELATKARSESNISNQSEDLSHALTISTCISIYLTRP